MVYSSTDDKNEINSKYSRTRWMDATFSINLFQQRLSEGFKIGLTIVRGTDSAEYHFIMDQPFILCTLFRSNVRDILRLPKNKFTILEFSSYINSPYYLSGEAPFRVTKMAIYPKNWNPCFDGPPERITLENSPNTPPPIEIVSTTTINNKVEDLHRYFLHPN